MNDSSVLRKASFDDLMDIHRLCIQLGYQPPKEQVLKSLNDMLTHSDYDVVVAIKNEKVVGWMSLFKRLSIEGGAFLQIAAIVTDESVRGEGFGRRLLMFAEQKAKDLGFDSIGLHSNKRRIATHEFYKKSGYAIVKESYFFEKKMTS